MELMRVVLWKPSTDGHHKAQALDTMLAKDLPKEEKTTDLVVLRKHWDLLMIS